MYCTQHNNQVTLICIAPHQNYCQRRLCSECQDEHKVYSQYIFSIKKFQKLVDKKLEELKLDKFTEIQTQRKKFQSLISENQIRLQKILVELSESIQQIYDAIESENTSYLTIIKEGNPIELSNTDFERLVQIVIGKALDVRKDFTNSFLASLEKKQNQLEQETKAFSETLKKKMIEKISKIQQAYNSELRIQPIQIIEQGYERKENVYDVLELTKKIDEQFLKGIIKKVRKEKITDCIEFLINLCKNSNMYKLQRNFITNIIQNIGDINFNKENYSTIEYQQIRKDLIKQIAGDGKIVNFLMFLVQLTAVDEKFIQSGSNSLNLLVEMKVNMKEQNFENIRIKDSSLIGGNFLRCNFNGSHFDNVEISGVNLNQAQLFNCKWRKIKINEEEKKLDGHLSYVQSVCFSPDGTILASGSYDGSIRFWDVRTGQQQAKLNSHGDDQSPFVCQICFSPDGTTLASGCYDNSIRLWDVQTCQLKGNLQNHNAPVYSVCFSPDGTTLASGSQDNSICLWDVKLGQKKCKLEGQNHYVYYVCFSPDGTILASGSDDNSIRLWDVRAGQQKAKLDHSEAVNSICYSPDGTTLASGSDDKSIRLWDVKTGQQKAKLDGHSDCVRTICYSPDGTTLASGSYDNSIRLWDVKIGQQKAKLDGHSSAVNSICYSPDGTTLASGSSDNSIRLWDVKTEEETSSQNNSYKDILASLKHSTISNNVLPESSIYFSLFLAAPYITILKISQNPNLEAQGALILKGEFADLKGQDLKSLFKSKGSLILENELKIIHN